MSDSSYSDGAAAQPADRPEQAAPRLMLQGITKQYPAVRANDDVTLIVAPGEIHAVLGENGAGKSTLMKIIYGAVRPDAGEIRWEGQTVEIANPAAARKLGIGMVFQHFSLFETLTVGENIALALDEPFDLKTLSKRIREVSADYGLDIDPQRHVHSLTVGERQRVEIVRCLLQNPRLLIMDEPTSVLTPQAVRKLFATLRRLAAEGCSILYISHKLDEIRGTVRRRDGDARRPRDRACEAEGRNPCVARTTDGRPFAAGLHAARTQSGRGAARREAPLGGKRRPVRHLAA